MNAPVNIWTDGACSGNPGPMGIGVVVLDGDTRRELGEHLGDGTSNIAELVAIERGLLLAVEVTGAPARPMRVHSDSAYAIGILSKGWKAKANMDLVARIRRLLSTLPGVTFVKVRGHNGVPENERCDHLATRASTQQKEVPAGPAASTRAADLDKADGILRREGFRPVAWQDDNGVWVGDNLPADKPLEFAVSTEDGEETVKTAADLVEAVRRARAGKAGR